MRCYSRYNSAEEKRKRRDRSSRAANARWDAYHALFADEPIRGERPEDMYEIVFRNLMTGETKTLLYHPGTRSNNYRVDVNGEPWRITGFCKSIELVEKAVYRHSRKAE